MFPFSGMLASVACKLGLSALSGTHTTFEPNVAHAGIRVKQNGDAQTKSNLTWTDAIDDVWIVELCKTSTIGDGYECFLSGTGNLASLTGDVLDTWLPVTQDREWLFDRFTEGIFTFTGTLQIREIANPSDIVSAPVLIVAQVTA